MRNKLTNRIFIVATILASVLTLFFGIYEYKREHAFRVDILHSQLQLNNYRYLNGHGDREIRVTVIDTLGNVLSDTEEDDVQQMGNHLQREEIQEALRDGNGFAIKRASQTNGEKYFYSATLFHGTLPTGEGGRRGFIVRSSVPYSAELTSSLEHDYTFFYYTATILALIATAMYFRHRYEHSEREKQRIKRQLTENAAHELKTPAATIQGYLETLVSNPTMSETQRNTFLQRCHAQSQRMSSLLTDMNMLSRLDEAQELMKRQLSDSQSIDAAAILRQIQEETAATFREQDIRLEMVIPEVLPMRGDATLIYSLFRNIFNNTLAYATRATLFRVQVKISKGPTLRGTSGGETYTFLFIDNGAGVPTEHLPHIFERFYRIDKGRSRRLGGTGLGLAIVKNIALQYGGHATATTTPGGGLTVEVALANS